MKLSVNLNALPGLTELLYRRRDDLVAGRVFVDAHTEIDSMHAGLLNICLGAHHEVVAAVDTFLTDAAQFRADYLGAAVAASVAYYRRTDASAAIALDASYRTGSVGGYPGIPHPTADLGLGPDIFDEPTCSGGYPVPHDYRFDYQPIHSKLDLASPTTYVRGVVWQVTSWLADAGLIDRPIDILQEYVEPVTGDWAAFRRCADVWATVAAEVGSNADWIDHAARALPSAWTGNAASDCDTALETFVTDLRAAAGTLGNLAQTYRETAEQVKALTDLLITALTALIDTALEELASSKLGPEFAIAGAATNATRIARQAYRCREIVAAVAHLVEGAQSAIILVPSDFGVVGKAGPLRITALSTVHIPGDSVGRGGADKLTPQPV
jgi:hypothetical protein